MERGSTVSQAMEVAFTLAFPTPEEEVAREDSDCVAPEDDEAFDYDSAEETVAFINGDQSLPVVALGDKEGRVKLM